MAKNRQKLVLTVLGPTASGKSKFALEIAARIPCEIVCLDSTTVYEGFDLGSSKPSLEDRKKVPHHLLDILKPMDPFSAHHFVERASETISEIHTRGNLPVLVGGTYFYLRALQQGMYPTAAIPNEILETIEKEFYDEERFDTKKMHEELEKADPEAARNIHPNDKYRLVRALAILRATGERPSGMKAVPIEKVSDWIWSKYALVLSRHQLHQRIVERTEQMLRNGLVNETKQISESCPTARGLRSIGYAECARFLQRQLTEKQLRNEIIEKTRQFAKRQWTWLRGDYEVRFVDHRDGDRVVGETNQLLGILGG